MKILIGVCGIGKGHCIREYEISKELIKRGHEVRILTYNEGVNFFENTGIKTYNVYVPIILSSSTLYKSNATLPNLIS